MAADLLQTIINKAKDNGILKVPLEVGYTSDFPIIQYADDTLLIMEACPLQLFALKAILNTFANSTGLKVNYSKSSMPFTYLGLPLSINKPTVHDCMPLTQRVERRLISTSMFLTQGGKLEMVNSVLSSLATYYMCSINVTVTCLHQVDKYRRHCLWRGGDITSKKPPLASWKIVTKPKLKGGLGVINLRLHNEVLLMKNLHKFFNK
jgi:hypothetical protein